MKNVLIKVLADLIDLKKAKERKLREAEDRKKHNEQIKRGLKAKDYYNKDKERSDSEDDYVVDEQGRFSPEKSWQGKNIPDIKDLGVIDYFWEGEWNDYHDAIQDFFDKTEEKADEIKKDNKILENLIKEHEKENPKWRFDNDLKKAYEEGGVDTSQNFAIQFYQLPEDQFDKANVGPSKNLKEPEDYELEEAINDSLDGTMEKSWIVIYTDEPFKYKKLIKDLKKEQERKEPA
jgi:hypothetical protein